VTGNTIMAGWASEEMTPELPCWLGGYASRDVPAHAVHDPLYVRALALGSVTAPFVLITCDLLGVNDDLLHEARHHIEALLPDATMWLAATHTHSGPAIELSRFMAVGEGSTEAQLVVALHMSEQSARVGERIVAALVQAAQDAVARMHMVEVAWASAPTRDVVTNRDHPGSGEDTTLDLLCLYEISQDPSPVDPQLFRPPAAILGSFPCHPTVLSAENLEISADLPSAFRRQLRALCGMTTWVMLATGAAGDMSTRHTRRGQSFQELERLGEVLAQQALEMLANARALQLGIKRVGSTIVELAMKSPADAAALEQYAMVVQTEMLEALKADNTAHARTLETTLQGIQAAKRVVGDQAIIPQRVELSTVMFGELALVAVPGEMYNRLGMEIRHSIARPVLLLGYSNGYIGYLPTSDAYTHLDYEVLMSPFAPGSGERVRDAAIQLLNQTTMTEEGDILL
jgi:neutral ceramidase